jgi:hypothetical protein
MSAEYGASGRDFELISEDHEKVGLSQTSRINRKREGHPDFGVALVEPWWSLGVALGWL